MATQECNTSVWKIETGIWGDFGQKGSSKWVASVAMTEPVS